MKNILLLITSVMLVVALRAEIKVSDVQVFSGSPWKEVVVGYTITGSNPQADTIRLTAADQSANKTYVVETGSAQLVGGSLSEGRHVLRWNAAESGVKFSSSYVVFSVSAVAIGGVQLWKDGPYWAESNVGAEKPEDYGYYFMWGDAVGATRNVDDDGWMSVKNGYSYIFGYNILDNKNNAALQDEGYIDATGNLAEKYDAATQCLGRPWRMPTKEEWRAVQNNCDTSWTTRNGVYGRLIKGRGAYASKSIFLPAAGYGSRYFLYNSSSPNNICAGYYWTSTPDETLPGQAWSANFASNGLFIESSSRGYGRPIRPLRELNRETVRTVVVSFDGNGGAQPMTSSKTVICGQSVGALPTVSRAGYELIGWFTAWDGGERVTTETIVSEDVTYYARWMSVSKVGGVQLWENGPYWAECNVGAMKPEAYGYYFWWGDTVGCKRTASNDGWVSVGDGTLFCFTSDNCPTSGKDRTFLWSQGYIDATGNLVAKYDASEKYCGAPWRMPTAMEWEALISNCDTVWTMRNGVDGMLVTGKGAYASKSIFLPAVGKGYDSRLSSVGSHGYYWTSTCSSRIVIYYPSNFGIDTGDCYYGGAVRPVWGFDK